MTDEDIVKEFLGEIIKQTYDYHYLFNNEVTGCVFPLDTIFMKDYYNIVPVYYDDYILFNIIDLLSHNIFYTMVTYDKHRSMDENVKLLFSNNVATLKYEQ